MAVIPKLKKSGANAATQIKTAPKKKTCMSCPEERALQPIANFYSSNSPLHADHKLPMCSLCIKEKCFDKITNEIDIEKFKDVLRQLDKPFIQSVFDSSVAQYNKMYAGKNVESDSRNKIVGYYFKNIQTLRQYSLLDWKQGLEFNQKQLTSIQDGVVGIVEDEYITPKSDDERYFLEGISDFKVTEEMINLFGGGYKKEDYKLMWDKYQFLKKSYPDITNLHTEALITYVRFKVKEEQAVAKGNAADADKWSTCARNAADKAKINPSQLSQSDLQGGLNSFSELLMSVEQAVDIIPILPRFKYRPNDAIDFNIWCLVNYLRDLEGKPLCRYEDIYNFYDVRKKEYISQYGDPYGIFNGDTTESNRESIKKFITLPTDYSDGDS